MTHVDKLTSSDYFFFVTHDRAKLSKEYPMEVLFVSKKENTEDAKEIISNLLEDLNDQGFKVKSFEDLLKRKTVGVDTYKVFSGSPLLKHLYDLGFISMKEVKTEETDKKQ